MNVSRRSSGSSRSYSARRPVLSISKASAAPSISLVVAESQPQPRLERKTSASFNLKEMWRREKEPSAQEESSKAAVIEPIAESPVVPVLDQSSDTPEAASELVPEDNAPVITLEPASEAAAAPAEPSVDPEVPESPPPSSTVASEPVAAADPEPDTSTISFPSTSPPSRSWFSSLGRSRGRNKARLYVESTLKESTTIADSKPEPEPEEPVGELPPSSNENILSESPTSSEPQPIVRPTPPTRPVVHSVASSIDEHVPSLPSTPPASNSPIRQRVQSSPSLDLNSLNPSTSRFALSIPLLGRPKVPLEEIMVKSAPSSLKESSETETVSGRAQDSSWWSYVGWTSTPEPSSSASEQKHDGGERPVESKSEERRGEAKQEEHVPQSSDSEPPSQEREQEAQEDPALLPARDRTMSVLSSESHASWFTPWAWYTAPEPTVTQSAPELRETPVEDTMTPSERVREEALARETASATVETAISSTITETTVDNRSTWSSFFASVSRKSIPTPVKRDEDGNEIMDIDDEPPVPTPPKSPAPSQKLLEAPPTPAPSIKDVKISKKAPAPQLVVSEDVKKEASSAKRKSSSSSPSPKDKKREKPAPPPQPPRAPNLVLPTWEDTFNHPPRAAPPKEPASISDRFSRFITGKGKSREETLPFVLEGSEAGWAKGCRRVVVFGIHGWFPGAIMRTMFGEPTGTSPKFVAMMEAALEDFQKKNDVRFEKVTGIPLEGEGTIGGRVERLYKALVDNQEWMKDLHEADAVLIATHSQGSVVSTHLLSRLIEEGHIMTALSARAMPDELIGVRKVQRVCCLALCGIHLGPLRYLSSSSLLSPYFQYLENQAARELFEFQNTDNEVSKAYVAALTKVLAHGTKMVYVASMDDQVVPIYSGIFATASHPLILRAMYIDGDAYHSSDFLSNLLVLLTRVMNAGLRESGLISLLSEATAGSLSGVGHSTAYEETATYSLAVNYLFKTTPGPLNVELQVEDFDAAQEQNDYEIPWALRDLIAEERVRHLFGGEIGVLRGMFSAWKPRTAVLRDVKRKLGPIQRLGSIGGQGKTQGKTNEGRTSPSKL